MIALSSSSLVSLHVDIPTFLRPLFQRAEVNAANYLSRSTEEHDRLRISKEAKSSDQVFFHLQFHPNDPPSRDIQSIWREHVSHPPGDAPLNTLKNLNKCAVGFSKLVVAYSRPLNLRNRFTVRDIHNRGRPVSEYLVAVCAEGSLSHSHVLFVLHRLPRLLAGTPTPLNITITAEEPRGETAAPPSCPLLIGSLF